MIVHNLQLTRAPAVANSNGQQNVIYGDLQPQLQQPDHQMLLRGPQQPVLVQQSLQYGICGQSQPQVQQPDRQMLPQETLQPVEVQPQLPETPQRVLQQLAALSPQEQLQQQQELVTARDKLLKSMLTLELTPPPGQRAEAHAAFQLPKLHHLICCAQNELRVWEGIAQCPRASHAKRRRQQVGSYLSCCTVVLFDLQL